MGKKINRDPNTKDGNEPENNPSTKSSTKRGRPRKTDGDNDNNSRDGETETNFPKLVLVDVPDVDPDQGEIIDNETPKKKPTSKKKKKDITNELKKDQLAVLVKTVFDVIGSRKGFEIWKLSQQESILIAEPLTNIFNKNPLVDKIAS